MSNVKTTAQLREFLLSTMEEVKSGKLTFERATVVIKGAAQVNESIYAELKARQLAKALGEASEKFGKLALTE